MNEQLEEFVENCKMTKRELLVLKTVREIDEELDQEEPPIMKEIVENSEIDNKTLHDGWRKLGPKGLINREQVQTSSQITITDAGREALQKLEELNDIIKEARE